MGIGINLNLNELIGRLERYWHSRKQEKRVRSCLHQWVIYHDSVDSQCNHCQAIIKTITLLRLRQQHGDDWGVGMVVGEVYNVRILDTRGLPEISYPAIRRAPDGDRV